MLAHEYRDIMGKVGFATDVLRMAEVEPVAIMPDKAGYGIATPGSWIDTYMKSQIGATTISAALNTDEVTVPRVPNNNGSDITRA